MADDEYNKLEGIGVKSSGYLSVAPAQLTVVLAKALEAECLGGSRGISRSDLLSCVAMHLSFAAACADAVGTANHTTLYLAAQPASAGTVGGGTCYRLSPLLRTCLRSILAAASADVDGARTPKRGGTYFAHWAAHVCRTHRPGKQPRRSAAACRSFLHPQL
jgi:hypothetical protein